MPQPGPLALPTRCPHRPRPTSPPATFSALGVRADEGLACGPFSLQQLHPLLELSDVRLQVSIPGLGLAELTAGR